MRRILLVADDSDGSVPVRDELVTQGFEDRHARAGVPSQHAVRRSGGAGTRDRVGGQRVAQRWEEEGR